MALISKPYTFSAGATIVAAEHNSNFDTIYNEFNGLISNANISGSAGITDSKLAQLTTAGKVSGAAVTLLTSLPSGAGIIPTANLASGTATSSKLLHGDQTWTALTSASLPSGVTLQTTTTSTGALISSATAIPFDDTKPQNTEGVEVLTLAITPASATNKLRIDVVVVVANDTESQTSLALFQDSTADALLAVSEVPQANNTITLPLVHVMDAGTTSATTFKIRVGGNSGTVNINGTSGSRKFGGIFGTRLTITEFKV